MTSCRWRRPVLWIDHPGASPPQSLGTSRLGPIDRTCRRSRSPWSDSLRLRLQTVLGNDDRRRMAALGRPCFRTNGQYTARRPRAAILRADDARIVRRRATRECVETTTHIPLAADGVAMVQTALRDK